MIAILIVVLIFLLIVAVIDFRLNAIPSVLLTGILFVVAMTQIPQIIPFGVLSFIMGWLLYEADFFSGIADIKVMTLIGFLTKDLFFLSTFFVMTLIFGIAWKIGGKYVLREREQIAFIPVFVFTYVALWLVGGLIGS